jgi:hypothetical protein
MLIFPLNIFYFDEGKMLSHKKLSFLKEWKHLKIFLYNSECGLFEYSCSYKCCIFECYFLEYHTNFY